jgi:hypothetical protein
MFYIGIQPVAWIFFGCGLVSLYFYFFHVKFLQKNSVIEMDLKKYETEKYWEMVDKNPDILAEREKRVGFA